MLRASPLLVAFALGSFRTSAVAQELDSVELDIDSGTTSVRLPFDVPFLLTGAAPAGSIQVELSYQEVQAHSADFTSDWEPLPALVSAIGPERHFRVRLGPFDVDRDFRFRLVFDRRLSSAEAAELRREIEASLERNLVEVEGEISEDAAMRMKTEIRLAFERSLNRGQPFSTGRGSLEVESRGDVFSDVAGIEALGILARDVLTRQTERNESLRLYRDTVPSLERELAAIRASVPLRALVLELSRRPELDPRNPRNPLFLAEPALELVQASEAQLSSLAQGRSPLRATASLDDSYRPEDADSVRSQYAATARALRELRDWLSSLVIPGASHHDVWERIAGASDDREALEALVQDEASPLRRAEEWAEVQESYLYDLEKALLARERALDAAAAEIESRALSARIRQTTTTEVLTTRANLYVGLDLGVLYSPELERGAASIGANIYFGPVNKKASLSYAGSLEKRLSMTVGLTVSELVLEDDPRVEPLLGSRYNLVLGAGYRFARSLRVGGGTLLLLKNDPNPLVTDRTLAWTPYFSFSFDVDIVGAFRGASR